MTLRRRDLYTVLIFVLGMTAIAVMGAGPALADASGSGGSMQRSPWPVGNLVHPPGEQDMTNVATGLISAAIVRPMKDKKFALALVAGTPTADNSSDFGVRQPVFKNSQSNIMASLHNETIQWVVLTDLMLSRRDGIVREAVQVGIDGTDNGEASWHYSVEMIFEPMASLAVRAAVSVAPGDEKFDAGEMVQALERSRIGVSIGLDYRPRDGIILDLDYARVMNGREAYQNLGGDAVSASEGADGDVSGEDVISISLSIQF